MDRSIAFALTLLIISATNTAFCVDPVVRPHENPNAVTVGVFKLGGLVSPDGFEGPEGTLGSGISPNEQEFDFYGGIACNGMPTIGCWNDSNHVVLRYCGTTGSLNARVDASPSYCMDTRIGIAPLVNYLQIDISNRVDGASARFSNVIVCIKGRRIPLGDFAGLGLNTWHTQGIDLTAGFSLEGDLILRWPANTEIVGQETNQIVIKLGAVPNIATASIGENGESEVLHTSAVAQR